MSLVARCVNMLALPGDVFDAIRAVPVRAANWLVPTLLLLAVSWTGTALILSQESFRHQLTELQEKAMDKQFNKLVSQGKLTREQADRARDSAMGIARMSTSIGTMISPAFTAFAGPFLWGLILWLVGGKIWDGGFSYMKAVEVAGLANVIGVVHTVVRVLLVFATGNFFASPSLMLAVKDWDPQNPAHALLAFGNVMSVWSLSVLSLGLARLGNRPFWKAAVWVFGFWFLYAALAAGGALAGRALSGG
jgi:hypothetical protein